MTEQPKIAPDPGRGDAVNLSCSHCGCLLRESTDEGIRFCRRCGLTLVVVISDEEENENA